MDNTLRLLIEIFASFDSSQPLFIENALLEEARSAFNILNSLKGMQNINTRIVNLLYLKQNINRIIQLIKLLNTMSVISEDVFNRLADLSKQSIDGLDMILKQNSVQQY